jgi:hypothetical protein
MGTQCRRRDGDGLVSRNFLDWGKNMDSKLEKLRTMLGMDNPIGKAVIVASIILAMGYVLGNLYKMGGGLSGDAIRINSVTGTMTVCDVEKCIDLGSGRDR